LELSMAAKETKGEQEGAAEGHKTEKKASPVVLIAVGAVALFVAVLGAEVAAPLLTAKLTHAAPKGASAAGGEQDEQQLAEASPGEEGEADKAALEPAIYTPLDPPFVVSFNEDGGESRFVQLTVQAMARSEKAIDAIKQHSPAIRNAFLFLISGYKLEQLATVEGKENLRAAMLKSANAIMEKNTGSGDIEELYFTSLVIQ
jgi:flagellar FliL protein